MLVNLAARVSTLQEIMTAVAQLNPREKALLAAELFAMGAAPDATELEEALERGLQDVQAGRLRPIEGVRALIPGWISKS